MTLTDEEFEELKDLQETFYYFYLTPVDDKEDHLRPFMIYTEQAELISRALTEVVEREIDKRREQVRVKSIVEQVLEKPMSKRLITKLEPKESCKYELPCGRCDLTKSLCSYNYEVTKDGDGI